MVQQNVERHCPGGSGDEEDEDEDKNEDEEEDAEGREGHIVQVFVLPTEEDAMDLCAALTIWETPQSLCLNKASVYRSIVCKSPPLHGGREIVR